MAKKKAVKKDSDNPYPYDLKDLRAAEKDFLILLGYDFHEANGIIFFPGDMVNEIYDILIANLQDSLENGTEDEKDNARWALARVHIVPLRVH